MSNQLLIGILSAIVIGILGWLAVLVRSGARDALDRRRVYRWLRCNTRDDPGESHVDTMTLAKGTGLPEDRVHRACISDKRVYRCAKQAEQWSVWRKEPQSIYAKRGILTF